MLHTKIFPQATMLHIIFNLEGEIQIGYTMCIVAFLNHFFFKKT